MCQIANYYHLLFLIVAVIKNFSKIFRYQKTPDNERVLHRTEHDKNDI